ncbi:acid phosphatase, partial [Francisella tularensis subsp. holarctica]|nr:acid phosphatase [Francisella tularensis subsp. holarctica]
PAGTGPLMGYGDPAIKDRCQPLPIMTLSADSRLLQFTYEQYLAVLKKFVYNSPECKNKTKEAAPNFAIWKQILGNRIS